MVLNPYFYLESLIYMGEKKLTLREADVLSCIMSAKTFKNLSHLLKIDRKTFETHSANVRNKLGLHSKEALVTHIEKLGKRDQFWQHYCLLNLESFFLQSFYGEELNGDYVLLFNNNSPVLKAYAELCKRHLELTGLKIRLQRIDDKNSDSLSIFVVNQSIIGMNGPTDLKNYSFEIKEEEGHFPFIFRIIQSTFKDKDLKSINKKFDSLSADFNQYEGNKPFKKINNKRKNIYLLLALIIPFSVASYYFYSSKEDLIKGTSFLPSTQNILDRSCILNLIDRQLTSSVDVRYAVLLGISGIGKTTIARLYAKNYKHSITWEINAQSKKTLERSFMDLALVLSKTEQDKSNFDFINKMNDPKQRMLALLDFIQKKMKKNPGWLLIFDNVISLSDIEYLLPKDADMWGNGKIILTTYNSNIKSSHFFSESDCFDIQCLTEHEKEILFSKIYCPNSPLSEDLKAFLTNIPPYPLDISICAHHLKQTGISPKDYLECLFDKDFDQIESKITRDSTHYTKTRHQIMIAAIKEILQVDKRFKSLLLLLSLCNHDKVPLDLFLGEEEKKLIDHFITTLREFSFIVNINSVDRYFDLHPALQDYIKNEIVENCTPNESAELLKKCVSQVKKYYEKLEKARDKLILLKHLDLFLKRFSDIDIKEKEQIIFPIHLIFAEINYNVCRDYQTAKKYYEMVLSNKKKTSDISIKSYERLAKIYLNTGDPHAAFKIIEKGLSLGKTNREKSAFLFQKGRAHAELNHFEDAEKSFFEALELLSHEQESESLTDLKSDITGYLSWLYSITFLTNDKSNKALVYNEKALSFYPKISHVGDLENASRFVAYHLTTLGEIYRRMGQYDLSVEKGYAYVRYFLDKKLDGQDHHILKILLGLGFGECSLRKGEYQKSIEYLDESCKKSKKLLGKHSNITRTAEIFLMESYIHVNKLDDAEQIFLQRVDEVNLQRTNYDLFLDALMHYNASILYFRLNEVEKCLDQLHIFFNKIAPSLKKSLCYPSEQADKVSEDLTFDKKEEDLIFYLKKAKSFLNVFYPTIKFLE